MRVSYLARRLTALSCLAAASVGLVANHAHAAPAPEKMFKTRDADGDGSLSEDEFTAAAKDDEKKKDALKTRFAKIDSDKDGKLSLDEFKAGMPKPKKKK